MDVPQEVIDLGARLAASAATNTATMVTDKVRALLASGKKDDAIAGLEEIVSQLIADKNELTRIAQAYQSELVAQRLTAGDVQYITDTVFPLIEQLAAAMGDEASAVTGALTMAKPLLSAETVNVLQILGFNFRRGIGEPLTKLTERAILSKVDRSVELQIENSKREQLYLQLAMDPDAFARFRTLVGS
jgi:hypothetical protein